MYRYIISLAHLALQVAMDANDHKLAHKLSEVIDIAREGRARELRDEAGPMAGSGARESAGVAVPPLTPVGEACLPSEPSPRTD